MEVVVWKVGSLNMVSRVAVAQAKSLQNPKDTYNSFSHTDSEKYFL